MVSKHGLSQDKLTCLMVFCPGTVHAELHRKKAWNERQVEGCLKRIINDPLLPCTGMIFFFIHVMCVFRVWLSPVSGATSSTTASCWGTSCCTNLSLFSSTRCCLKQSPCSLEEPAVSLSVCLGRYETDSVINEITWNHYDWNTLVLFVMQIHNLWFTSWR